MDFALAPALRARLLGTGLVAIGVTVALGALVAWLAGLSRAPSCPDWSSSLPSA